MLHIDKHCPICRYGVVGFRKCSDNSTIVLMCDECDSIWLDPQRVDDNTVLYSSPPEYLVPTLECSIKSPQSKWATQEEVAEKGWANNIVGKSKPLDEI